MSHARNVITLHAKCITVHVDEMSSGEIMLIYSACILEGGKGTGEEVTRNKVRLISLSRMRNQTISCTGARDRGTFYFKRYDFYLSHLGSFSV